MHLDSLDISGQDDGAQPGFWQGPPAQWTAKSGMIKLLLCSFGWQGGFSLDEGKSSSPRTEEMLLGRLGL